MTGAALDLFDECHALGNTSCEARQDHVRCSCHLLGPHALHRCRWCYSLFTVPVEPTALPPGPAPLARHGAETEEAGAEAAAFSTDSIKGRIHAILVECGPLTDDGIEVEWERRYGLPERRFFGNGLRRRRLELVNMGLVVDTGEKRRSRVGVDNKVWGISPLGRQYVAAEVMG